MRTLKGLPYEHNKDYIKFKEGTLQNEDDTKVGTPVIEQIYGDVLTNIYKTLEVAGITPNQTQDSESTSFQFVKALQNLTNELNDVEKIVSLSNNVWSAPIALEILPDNYFFFARTADQYVQGQNYRFKGSGDTQYDFISPTGFTSGDELLIIIDKSAVRAYSLIPSKTNQNNGVFTVFGNPVGYNDTDTLYYQSEGQILNDTPRVNNLQATIRFTANQGVLLVYDIMILKAHVLCLVFNPVIQHYLFYQFSIADLDTATVVPIIGFTIPENQDYKPYLFTDGQHLFFTNDANNSSLDNEIAKLSYSPTLANITYIETVMLNSSYIKSTNTIVKDNSLTTFINGLLVKHTLSTGTAVIMGMYNGMNGIVFCFNGKTYFTSGDVAKQWTI